MNSSDIALVNCRILSSIINKDKEYSLMQVSVNSNGKLICKFANLCFIKDKPCCLNEVIVIIDICGCEEIALIELAVILSVMIVP